MKKILLFAMCVILAGCVPVDRKNPTDPQASNYGGWTYVGEIGSFSRLSDFVICSSVPFKCPTCPKQDYILCIDYVTGTISQYSAADGASEGDTVPMFINAVGICWLSDYIYIIDKNPVTNLYAFETGNYATNWGVAVGPGDKLASCGGYVYVAVSSPAAVRYYTPDVFTKTVSSPSIWTIETNPANPGYLSSISDISGPAIDAANAVMIVDPDTDRISFFDMTGVFSASSKSFDIGTDITGAAYYNNKLYVPTKDGLRIIEYSTGNVLDTIFDYGDGNGKIIKPAQIELYPPKYVLINNDTSIKFFETSGL